MNDQDSQTVDPIENMNLDLFGKLLRIRRQEAGLSYTALAKAANVARATLVNIEHGVYKPSQSTVRRLVNVKALRLIAATEQSRKNDITWFCEAYNPMAMSNAMVQALNGPGGQIEQSYFYLDAQSAFAWFELANHKEYVTLYRSQIPFDDIAKSITTEVRGAGLDVDALGCGDGKTETELVLRLADLAPSPAGMLLYLLDISHGLLSEAYRHALDTLAPKKIGVFGVHGDFHWIISNPMLYMRPKSIKRVRLFLMMGYTLGNIRDEPWFFRNLAACAEPGDLAVLDFGIARGSVDNPDQIAQLDPAIKAKKPADIYYNFLTGPMHRHTQGCKSLQLRTELSVHCPIPGSYAIEFWAAVEKEYEPIRQFLVWRVKRYELGKLSNCLLSLGWKTLQCWQYGPEKSAAVVLVQRL
jgi:transcriptional regulator with XRE-family HTH domain